jgi:hypothetical protein
LLLRRLIASPTTFAHVALLVLVTGLKGLIWVGLIPLFMVADEPAHFDNVQFRAEHHTAPERGEKRIPKVMHEGAAPEVLLLWRTTIPKDYYYRSHAKDLTPMKLESMAPDPKQRDTDGQAPAIDYPGLYYKLAVPFYRAFLESSVVTRIAAVRMLSWLFGLCTVLFSYFAARLVIVDPVLALVAGLLVALQPMASQQTAAVNNDAGMIGVAAALFYYQLSTVAALPGLPKLSSLVGLGLCSVLLVAMKPTGYGILPGVPVALAIVAFSHRNDRRVRRVAVLGLALAVVAGVVLWQRGFTLDRVLPGDAAQPGAYGKPHFLEFLRSLDATYVEYLLRSAWGQFGWLDYSMSFTWLPHLRSVYWLIQVGSVVAIATWSLRAPDRPFWFRGLLFLFSAGTVLVGVAFILYVEHRFRLTGVLGVIQGRNFLFVIPAFGIWCIVSLAALVPARYRSLTAAMTLTGALCLHAAGIMTVLRQHYVH